MSLIFTDRNGDGRLQPSVDAIDVQGNPKAHNTNSISPRAVGTQTVGKVITKDSRIIANDGTNNVGLFGFDDAGNMVVKVAKPGFDANSATNDQLIFNSQQDTFKIVNKLTANFTTTCAGFGQNNTLFSVTHSLGYQPLYIASVNITTNTVPGGAVGTYPVPYFLPAGSQNGTGNNIWGFMGFVVPFTVSTSVIEFEAGVGSQNASGQTLAGTVTVYILQETAN